MSRIKHFTTLMSDIKVGSFLPTSQGCINRICKKIDFKKDITIVEYGPGTGAFTNHILKKMTPTSKLILIETNISFTEELKKIDDPRVAIFNDSAENVCSILSACAERSADYIISGIPFMMIDRKKKETIILNTKKALSSGGKFLVYQHSYHMKKYLRKYFSTVNSEIEIKNVPFPLFIMEAIKDRDDR